MDKGKVKNPLYLDDIKSCNGLMQAVLNMQRSRYVHGVGSDWPDMMRMYFKRSVASVKISAK